VPRPDAQLHIITHIWELEKPFTMIVSRQPTSFDTLLYSIHKVLQFRFPWILLQIQKLVSVFPSQMSDLRQEKLNQNGCPSFRYSNGSTRLGSSQHGSIPSDGYMYLESFHPLKTQSPFRLDFQLIGSVTPLDLSHYSPSVKRVVFNGHILNIKTAIQMANQLGSCEEVDFHLGGKFQLSLYIGNERLAKLNKTDEEFSVKVNPTVTSLSIHSDVSQHCSKKTEELKMIVYNQIEEVLLHGAEAFPNLTKMKVELPDDGIYLDMLKGLLPRWQFLKDTHSVEVQDGKIRLSVKKTDGRKRKMSIVHSTEQVSKSNAKTSKKLEIKIPLLKVEPSLKQHDKCFEGTHQSQTSNSTILNEESESPPEVNNNEAHNLNCTVIFEIIYFSKLVEKVFSAHIIILSFRLLFKHLLKHRRSVASSEKCHTNL
jgi:hypothetical protein